MSDILMNNEEITFKYTTKPIGKVVKQETFPTGIEFTINLNVEDLSDEEINDLIKYISKYGLFKDKLSYIMGIDLASGKDKVVYFDE